MPRNLLLEIGTEEIPARFMESALVQLKNLAQETLSEERIEFTEIMIYGTPRRLALLVQGVAE
ncbi:MAG: glycine--tRNA ligase subunit beta, partial [Syntrophomonadaceae bacterium]|nr:glycine--tRNA ligase subunit beta [Syntrophomonadaceae bacterium]